MRGQAGYSIAALDRAITVLKVFRLSEPELTLAEIARRTGLRKSTAFRILHTLVERGVVARQEDAGTYSLGYEILGMAEVAKRRRDGLVRTVLPVMRAMRRSVNETVMMCIRSGDYNLQIAQLEALHEQRRVMKVGDRKVLYAGASCKVLLAGMSDDEVADYLDRTELKRMTPTTITDKDALWAEVRRIRANGYAESRDECASGGSGAAALIRDSENRMLGALCVTVRSPRYTPQMRARIISTVVEGAFAASKRFGWQPERWTDQPRMLAAE